MNDDVKRALEDAALLYREYLAVTDDLCVTLEELPAAEPERSPSYPLGFALDERKVHALVG